MRLKGFKKVFIAKGATEEVTISLPFDSFKFYNTSIDFVAEPGEFDILIGTNSQETQSIRIVLEK
jgi:beta-glucosidase